MTLVIAAAETEADIVAARSLFLEYGRSLGFALCFDGFDKELERLPGEYAPPTGRLLLARVDGEVVGCVGLCDRGEGVGEMRRLYVRPGHRGVGVGRELAGRALAEAAAAGYVRVHLDTLPEMTAAQALYADLGFVVVAPCPKSPCEDALCMETALAASL